MDDSDSGEDLFITQSTFRTDTQDAVEAADFLDTSFNLDVNFGEGEIVNYMDFSKQGSSAHDGAVQQQHDAPISIEQDNVIVGHEPVIPLVANLEEEKLYGELPDEVVSAALDAALSATAKEQRFAEPVSDGTVKDSSTKGYVSFFLSNFKVIGMSSSLVSNCTSI